ncbi:hypothetical protein RhiJN_26622 [Ceratobasidium sp. AG-Ba]|nr:hypothetical protein RhiJN_26622 [Ceratobasidium sp. AG-Ba]
MSSKTRLPAQSRLSSNNAPAAKTTNPGTPADSPANPAAPDVKATCSSPTDLSEAIVLLSRLGYMLENNTIDRFLIAKVLGSVAGMAGVTTHASNTICAIVQLLPKAFDIGTQLQDMNSALVEISKKADAAERAAEESRLIVMSFVEQQSIYKSTATPHTTTEQTAPRTTKTQLGPNPTQDKRLPPEAIERCKFRAASVYVQPSEQHRSRIDMLDNQTLLERAASTFELAWADVQGTDFVESLRLRNKPTPKFESVKRLPNGTLLYQMGHRKHAALLSLAPIAIAFEQHFGLGVTCHGQQADIIMEGLPIEYDASNKGLSDSIERFFQLQQGSILSCDWAKPVSARTSGQKRAAIRLVLRSQDDADELIAAPGADLRGARLTFRRLEEDPIRCLRCQKFGHKSTTCRSPQDTSTPPDFNKRRPENRRPFFDPRRTRDSDEPAEETLPKPPAKAKSSDSDPSEQSPKSPAA